MLNISGLTEGIVLDHIQAGKSMDIYYKLGLEQLECQTAIIKNAKSSKMGKKDIIKIDGGLDLVNLDAGSVRKECRKRAVEERTF